VGVQPHGPGFVKYGRGNKKNYLSSVYCGGSDKKGGGKDSRTGSSQWKVGIIWPTAACRNRKRRLRKSGRTQSGGVKPAEGG